MQCAIAPARKAPSATAAERLVTHALEYLGTPWLHQGRLKGIGVDCVGLLVCAAQDSGMEVADVNNYRTAPRAGWLVAELERHLVRAGKPWLAGDVLAFHWLAEPWHVAIVTRLEPLMIVHSWRQIGRVVETPLEHWWRRHVHSAWRLPPGLADG